MSQTHVDPQVHVPDPSTNLASVAIQVFSKSTSSFSNSLSKIKCERLFCWVGDHMIPIKGKHIIFRICIVGGYLILQPCSAPRLPSPGWAHPGHRQTSTARCPAHCLRHPPAVPQGLGKASAVLLSVEGSLLVTTSLAGAPVDHTTPTLSSPNKWLLRCHREIR